MSILDTLAEVQEHDAAIDRLKFSIDSLPEKKEMETARSQAADLDLQIGQARARRLETHSTQRREEDESAAMTARIESLSEQMYSGSVTATKDLQAMNTEIEHLNTRRSEIDDRIIASMEEIESVDLEIAELSSGRAALDGTLVSLAEQIAAASSGLEEQMAVESAARAVVAGEIPGELMQRYGKLRERLGGIGVARLINGSCSGCHLTLPSKEIDAIRHAEPGAVTTCEQCGRILVP